MTPFLTYIKLLTLLTAAAGECLAKEASKTTTICYALLSDIPGAPTTEFEQILKEELLTIAQQLTIKKPVVSAAGFFEVNMGMMGFVLASVTSEHYRHYTVHVSE
ncbi:hypothetical protein JTB14_029984 [Gonioctena quinquepunctata]|nr:hypothetical protein JTB14_029984 [Gonioctena quinquepunctata]